MPAQTIITGQFSIGKDEQGVDTIIVGVSPFEQIVIPLPDDLPPGAPPEAKSARQLVKDHLNSGIVIPSDGPGSLPS